MKAVLVIELEDDVNLNDIEIRYVIQDKYGIPVKEEVDGRPLKPLNKIVKAGDRELLIYERKWLYNNLEREFELQKKARDFYERHEDGLED